MVYTPLTDQDVEVLRHAINVSDRLYVQGIHEVGGALRTATGEIFSGIHFEIPSGAVGGCGEIAAICCMVAAGHRVFTTITGVWRDPAGQHFLLPPCGRRGLQPRGLGDPVVAEDHWHPGGIEKPAKVRVTDLLPRKSHWLEWPAFWPDAPR